MVSSVLGSIFILFISIIFSISYQSSFGQLSFETISFFYNDYYLFFLFIILISSISRYYYNNDNSYLRRSRNRFSLYIFKYLSNIIHISTLFIVVCSILNNDFLNLDFHNQDNLRYIGVSICSIAITFFISSKISLGKNYSPCFDQRTPSNITTDGVYKFVRHPIYSSNILLLIGILFISGSYLIVINIILLSIFYIISAYREERYLLNKFSSYRAYSSKTGMFIPKYRK